jgi:hypothetical protein
MLDEETRNMIDLLRRGGVSGTPCDEFEARDLEQSLRVKFPVPYKAFLLIAGDGFASFEGSHDALEDDLVELQRTGKRIMEADGNIAPGGILTFFVHQGFVVRFFFLNDGNDPAVFEQVEHSEIKQICPHFSEFLFGEIGR